LPYAYLNLDPKEIIYPDKYDGNQD